MDESVYPDPFLDEDSPSDQQVISVVRTAYRQANRFKEPILKKWDYHFRLVQGRGSRDKLVNRWQTNRFVNLTKVASTLLKSRFYQGMPIGVAEARTEHASLNEDSLNSVLKYDQERGKLEYHLGKVIDDGINYACGILYQGWRLETVDNLPISTGFFAKMISSIKKLVPGFKEAQILYDGPDFRWVDPWTFWWDPNGTDIDDCSFCGESSDETIFQLKKDPAIDPEILKKIASFENTTADMYEFYEQRLQAMGLTKVEAKRVYAKVQEGLHEVHRYWGTYDIDGDGYEEECHIIVIDWLYVACIEENPFWHRKKPYSKWAFDEIPGFFVGYSLIDQSAQSQEEINDITNQGGDARKLTLFPVIKFKLGADVEPESLQIAPGMLWGLSDVNDVVIEQPSTEAVQVLIEAKKEEREIFQLLTGMNDVSLGQQDVGIGNNTATGAAIAQEQTELRYKAPAIGLDLFMERTGELLIWNEQQFRNRKEVVPVKAEGEVKYKTIAPKDISGLFSYRIVSSSLTMQTPTMRINNLLKAIQLLQGDPNYNIEPIKDQLIKELSIDPATLKIPQLQNMDAIRKFQQLPPQQQQAAIEKMNPDDQELMQKVLTQSNGQTAPSPTSALPQAPINPGGGAPQPVATPPIPTGVAIPR